LQEAKRDGEYFTVEEDAGGMYFFNSKDLNMMPHLKALMDTGVDGLKIEGRMKSELYIATITAAYRKEIDRYYKLGEAYEPLQSSINELYKATYRPYTTGFFFGNPEAEGQNVDKSKYVREWDYVGKILEADGCNVTLKEYNPFRINEEYEMLHPDGTFEPVSILSILDNDGTTLAEVKQPKKEVAAQLTCKSYKYSIIRKKLKSK
jgi:putative protease